MEALRHDTKQRANKDTILEHPRAHTSFSLALKLLYNSLDAQRYNLKLQ